MAVTDKHGAQRGTQHDTPDDTFVGTPCYYQAEERDTSMRSENRIENRFKGHELQTVSIT